MCLSIYVICINAPKKDTPHRLYLHTVKGLDTVYGDKAMVSTIFGSMHGMLVCL